MKLKIPPVLITASAILVMWCISTYLPGEYANFEIQNWIPLSIVCLGAIIGVIGVVQFSISKTTVNPHKPENSSSVVKNGIYKYTRNPMYLGLLLLLIACAIYFGSGYSFLMIPIFIWYMNTYQIKPEEEMLFNLFGDEYKEYQQKVRRWI